MRCGATKRALLTCCSCERGVDRHYTPHTWLGLGLGLGLGLRLGLGLGLAIP